MRYICTKHGAPDTYWIVRGATQVGTVPGPAPWQPFWAVFIAVITASTDLSLGWSGQIHISQFRIFLSYVLKLWQSESKGCSVLNTCCIHNAPQHMFSYRPDSMLLLLVYKSLWLSFYSFIRGDLLGVIYNSLPIWDCSYHIQKYCY